MYDFRQALSASGVDLGVGVGFMEEQEPDEATVVMFDVSQSMVMPYSNKKIIWSEILSFSCTLRLLRLQASVCGFDEDDDEEVSILRII